VKHQSRSAPLAPLAAVAALSLLGGCVATGEPVRGKAPPPSCAKNAILFVGDGMSVATVTAARIASVGVEGRLAMDRFPHTALSMTYTTDHIVPDSAGTMSAMITGVNTNNGIISMDAATERMDFNRDGDGASPWTLFELAEQDGLLTGIVTSTRLTHATPAACYAHINHRDMEREIAAQLVPGLPEYNTRLGDGVDVIFGGGAGFFIPTNATDERGERGYRNDGRDLREAFVDAGYSYVHDEAGMHALTTDDLPAVGLFTRSHFRYEHDRAADPAGDPALADAVQKAVELLEAESERRGVGYVLMVESGRIDHAHHDGNAWRAVEDTIEFDDAIGRTMGLIDVSETIVLVTADHSHTMTIGGYPVRPPSELPYEVAGADEGYAERERGGLFSLVYGLDGRSGRVRLSRDANGAPFTSLAYANGPGARQRSERADPRDGDPGPEDPDYLQEAIIPLASETHGAEEVILYGAGPGADRVRGTVKNTFVFDTMRRALGIEPRSAE